MPIGEKIRQKRIEKGWSQRDLAARMNYSNHSTIGKIETGKVDIPQSRIKQFADVFGVTPGHLMGWDTPPEDMGALAAKVLADPNLLKLVQNYLGMSEADQYAMRLMAESLSTKTKKD